MDQFYFYLIKDFEINNRLHFYFEPKDKLIKQDSEGNFAQHVIGVSKYNCFEKPNWETIFYGIIN